MATDWIMVRVSRSTHARLEAVRESMQLAADVGLRTLTTDLRDRVSLDQIIGLLIDIREKHAERRRRSSSKRKKRTAAGPAAGDQADVGVSTVLCVSEQAGECADVKK